MNQEKFNQINSGTYDLGILLMQLGKLFEDKPFSIDERNAFQAAQDKDDINLKDMYLRFGKKEIDKKIFESQSSSSFPFILSAERIHEDSKISKPSQKSTLDTCSEVLSLIDEVDSIRSEYNSKLSQLKEEFQSNLNAKIRDLKELLS